MRTIHLLPPITMNPRLLLTATIAWALTFTACERKPTAGEPTLPQAAEPVARTTTFETARLEAAIDTFEKAPTEENQSSVRLAFAKLDSEIAELQDRVVKTEGSDRAEAASKLNNLQRYRDGEMARFTKAQDATTLGANPPADSRSAGQKVEDSAHKVGEKSRRAPGKLKAPSKMQPGEQAMQSKTRLINQRTKQSKTNRKKMIC